MHPIEHFKTITRHRHLVCRYCVRLGLWRQGLTHDLSKYSPTEFLPGARYWQGTRSPNDVERRRTGVSLAWLHHKGRNRHRYVAEMFCDRVAASRVYLGDAYTDAAAWNYYVNSKDRILIHPETGAEIEEMLRVLKDEGEEAAFAYVRRRLREERKRARHENGRETVGGSPQGWL